MADLAAEMIDRQKAGGHPAGLALLEKVDGLFIEQQWEVLETVTCGCYEGANRYKVMDGSGKVQLYSVKEKTACCWRYCCGEHRPFTLNVMDETGAKNQRMMVLKRGYRFCGWAVCPCCMHSVAVHYVVDQQGNQIAHTGNDTLIAKVYVPWAGGCCIPTLHIQDREEKYMGSITKGGMPCCVADCCGADFNINDTQGKKIGEIKKLGVGSLKGVVMEMNTDADNFKITFPETLDPTLKMAILASLFQIDFSFFEDDRSPRECRCCDIYCCGWPMACFPKWMVCCCCYSTKEEREKAEKEKKKNNGAPQEAEMDR